MILAVIDASYFGDYKIALVFNDKNTGVANLRDVIFTDNRVLFSELRNENEFKKFKIEHDTLVWENGLDLAPEFLFFVTFKKSPKYQEQFKEWGYE
jgi:hypothetical protein